MNDALIAAIKDRVKLGWDKDRIAAEVKTAGHTDEAFSAAYEAATSIDYVPAVPPAEAALELGPIFKKSWSVTKGFWRLGLAPLLYFVLLIVAGCVLFAPLAYVFTTQGFSWMLVAGAMVIGLVWFYFATAIGLATLRVILRRFESEAFNIHLKQSLKLVVPAMLVSFYVGVVTQVGYALFYLPGVILAIWLAFPMLILLSGQSSGLRTLTQSAELVYGRFFKVFFAYLLNMIVLLLGVMGMAILVSLAVVEPMLLLVLVPVAMVAVLAMLWWQLCFFVVLYEVLGQVPSQKPLPISEKFWRNLFATVIGVVVFLIAVFAFLVGFGAAELSDLEQVGITNTDRNDGGLMQDIVSKQLLQSAVVEANRMGTEAGSYEGVCASLAIPSDANCASDAQGFRIEVPVSDGYYCVDGEVAETRSWPSLPEATTCNN